MRLRTLPVSTAGVLVACAYALARDCFRPEVAALCLVFAILAQITSNFANEYYDWANGSDRPGREGFRRGVTEGDISPKAMRRATFATLATACAVGCCLIPFGGWILVPIGIAIAVEVDPQSEDVAAYGDTIDTAYAAVDFLMVIVQNGGSAGIAVEDNSTFNGELQHTIAVNIMVGLDIHGNTCGNADVAETLNEVCLGQYLIVVRC